MWSEFPMGYSLGYILTNIFNFNVGDTFLQDNYELRIFFKKKDKLKFQLAFFGLDHFLVEKFKFNISKESLKDLFQFYIDKKHLPYEIEIFSRGMHAYSITFTKLPCVNTFAKGDLIALNTFGKICNITNV